MVQESHIALRVAFYQDAAGGEPVRAWIYELDKVERKIIGEDIKRVQLGWPLGMPVVKPLGKSLWEIRSVLKNRIARIIFTFHAGAIVLLHGFIKKTQKTPTSDLEIARKRASIIKGVSL